MTVKAAWDYAIGMIKVDGLEPTEDFKKYLDKKYKVKQDAGALSVFHLGGINKKSIDSYGTL